jgi:streptomycin 6-kinase
MVLEWAGSATVAKIEDDDRVVTIASGLNRRLAIPSSPNLPRLREYAEAWESELHADAAELDQALSRRVVDVAVAGVRGLARIQPDTPVHGGFHAGNILRAEREPWLAVDP